MESKMLYILMQEFASKRRVR